MWSLLFSLGKIGDGLNEQHGFSISVALVSRNSAPMHVQSFNLDFTDEGLAGMREWTHKIQQILVLEFSNVKALPKLIEKSLIVVS